MKKIQMISQENLSIRKCFNMYVDDCRSRNCTHKTIIYYQNTIHNFELFYDLDNPVKSINKELIKKYVIYLQDKGVSDATLRTYISGLRTILYFFMKENYIDEFKVPSIKADVKAKDAYTINELKALLKKPDVKKCSFAEFRNWVLVNYLLGTGQRLNTVVNIKVSDIYFDDDLIKLSATKGRRETILPLSSKLKKVLVEYLRYRQGNNDDYLFCTITGTQMTRGCITTAIKSYNLNRGVKRHSIHLFRNAFAKYYLMNGGDVFRLQKLMCHKNLETTKKYLSFSTNDLNQDYQKLNPLDTIGNNETITMR